MGKTRDLLKKIKDTKGTFHAKMGSIKERNDNGSNRSRRYSEVARIHKRTIQKRSSWPRSHDGVITHLEPDILECEVKWALGSITTNKASGGGRIPVELFQILKDDSVKVLHSICQQIWKTQQWPQDWKSSVFIRIPKKGNDKECSNYRIIALISHTSKVILKILQARLQQYMNQELQMFKLVLEKAEEPEIKLTTSVGSSKKQESSRKTSTSSLLTTKSLTMWITTNCGKFLKR